MQMTDALLAVELGQLYQDRVGLDHPCNIYPDMYPLFDATFHCISAIEDNNSFVIYSIINNMDI